MAALSEFLGEIEVIKTRVVPDMARRAVTIASILLHTNIVNKTPVDTGTAQANWNINPGSADRTVVEYTDASSVSVGIALAKQASLSSLQPYQPVTISNNVDYITLLEHGSSKQAPRGMVTVSVNQTKLELPSEFKRKITFEGVGVTPTSFTITDFQRGSARL